MESTIKKPSQFLHLTESIRSFFETIRGIFFLLMTKKSNEGNGRAVMVVPGLLATDFWTIILRSYLKQKGFTVYGWELGANFGQVEKLPLLAQRIQKISQQHNQKISIVGWSMGGLFCREVCHQIPDSIQRVITIGSPFANVHAPNYAKWIYELLNDESSAENAPTSRLPLTTPMSSVAIYSKKDGVLPWEACIDKVTDENHKNSEIVSSHFGMCANPNALKSVFSALTF